METCRPALKSDVWKHASMKYIKMYWMSSIMQWMGGSDVTNGCKWPHNATWPCGQGRCDPSPSRNHHRCLGARCGSEVVWRAGALLCVVCLLVDDDNDSTTRSGMNQLGYQLDWQREEVEDGGLLHSFHSLHLFQQNSKGQRKSCFGTPQHLLEKDGQTFQELAKGKISFCFCMRHSSCGLRMSTGVGGATQRGLLLSTVLLLGPWPVPGENWWCTWWKQFGEWTKLVVF